MKKLITIFLILCVAEVQSQVKLGIFVQPTMSFANWENYWFSCSEGFVANVKIYKPVSLNFGIGYQYKKYNLTHVPYMSDIVPMTGYTTQTIPVYIIPRVDFYSSNNKFKFYCLAGATMNFCIYEKRDYSNDQYPSTVDKSICFYNVILNFGLGIEYNLSIFSLFFEPAFNTTVARNLNYYQPYNNTISLDIGCLVKI